MAVDLGNVNNLIASPADTTIAGSDANFGAAGAAPLYVSYFAYDNATGNVWISAASGLGTFGLNIDNYSGTIGQMSMVAQTYKAIAGNASSAVSLKNPQGVSTFFNSLEGTQNGQGGYARMVDVTTIGTTTETLDLINAVKQSLYFFDVANEVDESDLIFQEVAKITTNANGTVTLNAANAEVPIPAAAYLLGSGLLGLVGLRRRMK